MKNRFRLWRHRLRRLGRLSWVDRLLVGEALIALAVARLAILLLPFRWLAPRLTAEQSSARPPTGVDVEGVRRVGLVLFLVARGAPWRSRCLEQALAGRMMLRRRGLPSTLYLGVAKEGLTVTAHAWLCCGDQIVTGAHEPGRFLTIARFGEGEP